MLLQPASTGLFLPRRDGAVSVVQEVLLRDPALLAQSPEDPARTVVEVQRAVELHDTPGIHNTNAVVVDNGAQAMRDTEERFALETCCNCALNLLVGLHVDRTGCFVTNNDLAPAH